jgi:heme-degrading monooxygenase HmoA
MIAKTPEVPYYAVIFTSIRKKNDLGYEITAEKMVALAEQQKGFLGVESARNELGITVSYWQTLEDIKNWKNVTEHKIAQKNGRDIWYASYKVRICKIERDYEF